MTRLAVDPAKFAGRPYVILLDDSENRLEADGKSVRRTRQVYQVLDQQVVRGLSERAFSYARSHQSLTLDWIRVLKPSGEVVSNKPAQEQETDVAAQRLFVMDGHEDGVVTFGRTAEEAGAVMLFALAQAMAKN